MSGSAIFSLRFLQGTRNAEIGARLLSRSGKATSIADAIAYRPLGRHVRVGHPSGAPLIGYHGMTDQDPTWSQALAELREGGGHAALDQLLPGVYRELCAVAHRQLKALPPGGSVQTGDLVHEAYLKFVGQPGTKWQDRAHFLALASVAMRHILVDRAKARTALKRGGPRRPITLDEDVIAVADQAETLLDIHEALDGLAETDARLARVVECRFFGGMSEEEIAEALGVTVRTVERDWAKARMLLRRALE